MGEGLGKVTKVLACGAIDLLFVEEEWSGKRKELLTQTPCPRRLADYGQR
jgi:ribosomal 30S subunit maturation factor RimM